MGQSDMRSLRHAKVHPRPGAWCGEGRPTRRRAAGSAGFWPVAAEGLGMARVGASVVTETGFAASFSVGREKFETRSWVEVISTPGHRVVERPGEPSGLKDPDCGPQDLASPASGLLEA